MNERLRIPRAQLVGKSFGLTDILPGLVEFWRRRELLGHMTVRHLRGQYKQSILGYAWAFVNPLSLMLILSFVFSVILRIDSNDIPYPLFLLVGLLPWIFFSTAVSSATDSITGAASLVTKIYFPREVLPAAAVLTKVVDLAFGLLILFGLMLYFGYPPEWTLLWVPVLFLIHLLPTLLDKVTSVVADNLRIDKLTILDGGDGEGLPGYVKNLTNSAVVMLEQLKNATGVDLGKLAEKAQKPSRSIPKELG